MAECCIVGCSNKVTKRGELKFYTLPTAKSSRPNKVKRRQLWLEAIEKLNGSTTGLKDDAQICSAHFVSGQMSLDVSDQDFVPSVFPKPPEKTRRDTLRPRSGVLAEAPKVAPKKTAELKRAKTREDVPQFNDAIFPENGYCEPLEDEELLEEKDNDVTQLSPKEVTTEPPTEVTTEPSAEVTTEPPTQVTTEPSAEVTTEPPTQVTPEPPIELSTEYPQLKKPKLELKSVIARSGGFQCEVCNDKFSCGSMLVKHRRLHDQEWPEDESLPSVSENLSENLDFLIPAEEVSFKCNMCDRSFPTIHNLKRHKLLHVRDSRKCKQCGTLFCKRHNHVIAQPQISTETNFEDDTTKDDQMNVCTENQMPDTNSCDGDNAKEALDLLLNFDSQTSDGIAATQEHSSQDKKQSPPPKITICPRTPSLLTSFKSFLTKHTFANLKTDQLKPSSGSSASTSCTPNVKSSHVTTPVVTPDSTIACPTTAAAPAPSATIPITATTTTATADTPQAVPEQSTKAMKTATNTLTPLAGKHLLFINKPSQPQPGQPIQNIEQSTVCLSFSKPLPSNVLKEFMSFISKKEYSKSPGPRLITFTSKMEEAAPKQHLPANQISSSVKLEPAAVSIQAAQLPNILTGHSNKEKQTFIITTQRKPDLNALPSLTVPSENAPPLPSSLISPVKPKPKPKAKAKKVSPPKKLPPRWKPYVHGSRPPSPELILANIQSGPWDLPFPNYSKDFIQPHLPQIPELPPSLQMFSPQFLTSSFLDVKRDYDYILSK